MKRHRYSLLLLSALIVLISCAPVDAEQQKEQSATANNLIARAKHVTEKYKLSVIKSTCLSFQVASEKFEDKPLVDVREIHNKECGGDPRTSPRIFSIAFDEKTGEIWSDAKSLVSQMEIIGKGGR